ncbi:hypothetical protein N657DRAFT_679313 [Parathielavia appendiculata]|uniref:Spastin/Vps4 C-terminal domain-containing protein n=1 Tax=Parathielavia appendiculata TaxID=2587402 RepID=A0AAN6Z6H0_9PEZI|nr:hypothetical protein N657DRAFT_679313 [Parathielavia appendiculata]
MGGRGKDNSDVLIMAATNLPWTLDRRCVQHNSSQYYTPCDKNGPFGRLMTWKKVPPNRLKEPPLTVGDLFAVMENVKPTVAQAELARYLEWTQQFGLVGA